MQRRELLEVGETYHVYNRGAHKQLIFQNEADYERFSLLLYLQNTDKPVVLRDILSDYKGRSYGGVFEHSRQGERPVDVLAYCLMPNHFHLVLRQNTGNGVSQFLKKIATSYSMYFNTKYEHSGVLFQGRFKSRHVGNESYFRWIFSYVHLNPLDLVEKDWKANGIRDAGAVRSFLSHYPHSSYPDYRSAERPQRAILSEEPAADFLRTDDVEDLLRSLHETENTFA